jgi:DNA-binding transcriptional MerR regulator
VSAQADVELLATGEVAEMLGIATQTVARYGRLGRLVTTRTLGRHHRFFAVEVRALADGVDPAEARALAEAEKARLSGERS